MYKTALIKIENTCNGTFIEIKYVPTIELSYDLNKDFRLNTIVGCYAYLSFAVDLQNADSRYLMMYYISKYIL